MSFHLKTKKDAESFVSNYKGKILSYKELAEHKWEMNKEMMGNPKKGKSRCASLILEKDNYIVVFF